MTYKGEHSTGYLFPTHKRLEHLIRSQHFTIRQPYDFSEGAVYLLRLFDLEDVAMVKMWEEDNFVRNVRWLTPLKIEITLTDVVENCIKFKKL